MTTTPTLERTDLSVLESFRRWGYLQADLDDLGRLPPAPVAELDTADGPIADRARSWYCGAIAVEFMHIPDPARRAWLAERIEREAPPVDGLAILERLVRAEVFESLLQKLYIGNKRFSLEGTTALIPLLDTVLRTAAGEGAEQGLLAMSHRGRLNVMAHIVGRPATELFAGFEDVDPRSVLGSGDVKYHLGATGVFDAGDGRSVALHLVSNPSHLEAVDPVAIGRVRAKQTRLGDHEGRRVLPVVMHGDAAFAGQGVVAETLNYAELKGFHVGGTVHVIVNNLIGFTAEPWALHSSRFAADVARRLAIPILHVNGERPDAVVRAARLATLYRYAFRSDVVIDLIGYRRHGHSEVDDPTITQPVLYKKIQRLPPLWQKWAETIGADPATTAALVERVRSELTAAKHQAAGLARKPVLAKPPSYWDGFVGGPYKPEHEVETGVERERLADLAAAVTRWPEGFNVHDKVKKLLEQRLEMGTGQRPVDYGMAEALAFASLLSTGTPVRLAGQDSGRGTFNHRHAVLVDRETEARHVPLASTARDGAFFEVYDSMLSEYAAMGFEYGFSRDYPEALVLWEAQFGDFVNGAQIMIDQFLSAGEDKWGLLSGLVLLLPHGFEGQGPEHSSARIERFLQLAGEDNLQVAQPSTAAQYFHLLRRQALRRWRKPLVVFTPKSMLRHPLAASTIDAFSRQRFLELRVDPDVENARRILFCSGKIAHELRHERARRKLQGVAVTTLEQLYPFPEAAIEAELARHPEADLLWVQEEPANMGAMFYVLPRLERLTGERHVRTVKRSASASPATGSPKAHALEQETVLALAFAGLS